MEENKRSVETQAMFMVVRGLYNKIHLNQLGVEDIMKELESCLRTLEGEEAVAYIESLLKQPPLPNCLPDDDAIKAKIKSLGWEVDGTAESNDMIELAKWMRSLAEKEIIGFAEWIDSKGAYRNFNYNPVIWQMKGDYKHYTTSELLTKYRESCLKQ